MSDVGYVRVSSIKQKTIRQLDGLKMDKIFEDKVSARTLDRPQLENCIEYLREGDTLHVHSMDRLARNLRDLERLVSLLNKKKVSVFFHKENLLFDANKKTSPMNELLFNIIGAVAQFERALIRERQLEGIELAKRKGAYKGAKPRIDRKPILNAVHSGMKKTAIQEKFGISHAHLYRIIREEKNKNLT